MINNIIYIIYIFALIVFFAFASKIVTKIRRHYHE
jgi:hypothetical protein